MGALEIAAERWSTAQGITGADRFRRYLGPLYGRLKKYGDEVVNVVAAHLGQHAGAQARFIDFTVRHAATPPGIRPQFGAVDWSQLSEALAVIYDWRSHDLHAGVPFPGPMCEPPQSDGAGVFFERFPALAAQQAGGAWPAERLPMYLHLFAFIARQALTSWWAALPDAGLTAKAADAWGETSEAGHE